MQAGKQSGAGLTQGSKQYKEVLIVCGGVSSHSGMLVILTQ